MSHFASPVQTNQLVMSVIGLDDELDESSIVPEIGLDKRFDASLDDTVVGWSRSAKEAAPGSIFVADNRIDGVTDLKSVGYENIKTGGGNRTGLKLLTEYCKRERLKPGVRIIFSNYELDKRDWSVIERLKKEGENFEVVYKFEEDYSEKIKNICDRQYRLEYSRFIEAKFDFILAVFDDWGLDDRERARFFGSNNPPGERTRRYIMAEAPLDIEVRCDLIHRLRSNLDLILGEGESDLQAEWLRRAVPMFDDESAIAFLGEGFSDRLAELVFRLEQS